MFFGLDKKSVSLISVATDVWNGFIFINLDPQPKETLREYLGELWDMFAGYGFNELPASFSYSTELESSWAVARDSSASPVLPGPRFLWPRRVQPQYPAVSPR